jgi:magnesium transporter
MPAPVTETNLNDPVVRHMRTDLARLDMDDTVGEALAAIRQSPPPARIVYFYVVDAAEKLRGVIPARALLLSPPPRSRNSSVYSSTSIAPSNRRS